MVRRLIWKKPLRKFGVQNNKILRILTLLQSHIHCEHGFVVKLKRVKILDFIILDFMKLPVGRHEKCMHEISEISVRMK